MSDKEKLDVLCISLKHLIKNARSVEDTDKKWRDFGLLGSIQTRKARIQGGKR